MDIHGPDAVCRACGMPPEKGNIYTPLFEASAPDKSCPKDILEIIEILNLNFKPNDGLPQKICFSCMKTLAVISEFRKRCEDLQKILAFYHISLVNTKIRNETRNKNSLGTKSKEISIDISEDEPDNASNLSMPEIKRETSDEESKMKSSATLSAQDSDDREVARRLKRKSALACLVKFKNNDFESNVSFADDDEDDYTPNFEEDSSDDVETHDLNLKDYDAKQKVNGSSFQNQFELMGGVLKLKTENGDTYLINEVLPGDENSDEEIDSIILSSDEDDLDLSDSNGRFSIEFSLHSRDMIDRVEDQNIEKTNEKNGEEKNEASAKGKKKRKTNQTPTVEKTHCPYCKKLFVATTIHMRNCRMREGHVCKYCDSTLDTAEELTQHVDKMHPERLPACHICFSTFENANKRRDHIREQHLEVKYQCIPCNRSFKAKSTLKEHNARIHTAAINKACPICNKICKSEFIYKKHQKQHRNTDRLRCKFCGKLFTRLLYKTNHELTHTGEKPFLCDACGKSFVTRTEINLHINSKHGDQAAQQKANKQLYRPRKPHKRELLLLQEDRIYKCKLCGGGFKQEVNLRQHIRRIHFSSRNVICTVCGKSFRGGFELRNHMYVHKDEFPLKCDKCPLTFEQKKLLKEHAATHYETQYACHLCSKTYRYSAFLATHLKTHTEEKPKNCKDKEKSMKKQQIAEDLDLNYEVLLPINRVKC